MPTIDQDHHWNTAEGSGITITFWDASTPPRPAKIDTTDRQPVVQVSDPTIITVGNLVVAGDNMSVTLDCDPGAPGDASFTVDCDVNLASGEDTSLIVPSGTITVTPGPAGQAASGQIAFGTPTPKSSK
jgi:hypothetical protein